MATRRSLLPRNGCCHSIIEKKLIPSVAVTSSEPHNHNTEIILVTATSRHVSSESDLGLLETIEHDPLNAALAFMGRRRYGSVCIDTISSVVVLLLAEGTGIAAPSAKILFEFSVVFPNVIIVTSLCETAG